MKRLLLHGCFDATTLQNIINLGASGIAFDLRSKSRNLIPCKQLLELLPNIQGREIFLTFENDKKETILSYLDILKVIPQEKTLIFRDSLDYTFYQGLNLPFMWMFHPEGDWQNIMTLQNLRGIILPIEWQNRYKNMARFWELLEGNSVEVYLHANSFSESINVEMDQDLHLSIDLSPEIEKSYRLIDQEKLKKLNIWRSNESSPL